MKVKETGMKLLTKAVLASVKKEVNSTWGINRKCPKKLGS